MMMETKKISETSVFNSTFTQLVACEDFSTFIRRESFTRGVGIATGWTAGFDSRQRQDFSVLNSVQRQWVQGAITPGVKAASA
jgi:hypothetical protein